MEIFDREGIVDEKAGNAGQAGNADGKQHGGRGFYEAPGVEIDGEKAPKKRGRPRKAAAFEEEKGQIAAAMPRDGEKGRICCGNWTEPPIKRREGQLPGKMAEKTEDSEEKKAAALLTLQ